MPFLEISDTEFFSIYQSEAVQYRKRASQSLLNEFRKLKSTLSKRGLLVHIFMVYMQTVEDLARTCSSLVQKRHYQDKGLVEVWCSRYLDVSPQQSNQVLVELDNAASNGSESIREYLSLPCFEDIVEGIGESLIITKFNSLENAKGQYATELGIIAERIHDALSIRSRVYNDQVEGDMSLVDLYNSVKHGLRVFTDPRFSDEVQIIWKSETDLSQRPNINRLSTVRFKVDLDTALHFHGQVQAITSITDALWGVWKFTIY